jgi:hypothetical protein
LLVQEDRLDNHRNELAGYTFSMEMNANYQLGTGFFVHKVIISAFKRLRIFWWFYVVYNTKKLLMYIHYITFPGSKVSQKWL